MGESFIDFFLKCYSKGSAKCYVYMHICICGLSRGWEGPRRGGGHEGEKGRDDFRWGWDGMEFMVASSWMILDDENDENDGMMRIARETNQNEMDQWMMLDDENGMEKS